MQDPGARPTRVPAPAAARQSPAATACCAERPTKWNCATRFARPRRPAHRVRHRGCQTRATRLRRPVSVWRIRVRYRTSGWCRRWQSASPVALHETPETRLWVRICAKQGRLPRRHRRRHQRGSAGPPAGRLLGPDGRPAAHRVHGGHRSRSAWQPPATPR